jgi:hypothetical protein
MIKGAAELLLFFKSVLFYRGRITPERYFWLSTRQEVGLT